MAEMQALRKKLESKGILNLPELVDVEDYIKKLEGMLDKISKLPTYCISNGKGLYRQHNQGAFVKHSELTAILEQVKDETN